MDNPKKGYVIETNGGYYKFLENRGRTYILVPYANDATTYPSMDVAYIVLNVVKEKPDIRYALVIPSNKASYK
jgi:hypothetical protein